MGLSITVFSNYWWARFINRAKILHYTVFILFNTLQAGEIYFHKPDSPVYSIGQNKIFTVVQEKDGVVTTFNETFKVIDQFELSGQTITNWEKTNDSTNTKTFLLDDKYGSFRTIGSSETDELVKVSKIISNNLGNYFVVGNIIEDKSIFFSHTAKIGGLPFSGTGVATIKSILLGKEFVESSLGTIECYKIIRQTSSTETLGNSSYGLVNIENKTSGTVWISNTHGKVKSELNISIEVNDGMSQTTEKSTEISTLIYSPFDNEPLPIKSFEHSELLNNQMKGWMWMGSFPWIYNANTNDWGYLVSKNLYLWDASESKWLFFDQVNQSWNYVPVIAEESNDNVSDETASVELEVIVEESNDNVSDETASVEGRDAIIWKAKYEEWVKYPSRYGGVEVLEQINNAKNQQTSSLNLSNSNISDISPLAGLVNLKKLELKHNNIADLSPLASLTELTSLDLYDNNISDLTALSELRNLVILRLPKNNIVNITSLHEMEKLTELILWDNNISDLSPISNLIGLRELHLGYNNIEDINPLAGLINLKNLNLRMNKISNIDPIKNLTDLEGIFRIDDNNITDINALSFLSSVRNLIISNNRISDLSPLRNLYQLSALYASKNLIENLEPLSDLTDLTHLYLDDNIIKNLSPITGLTNLKRFSANRNDVSAEELTQLELKLPNLL